ncbi:DNA adenine methylase [Hathewaya histolytica]|uniref:Adenine-specific DNA-methyltransferase n=1 Tax=Hathewaya histolytica TaxID=1498 RepID=A0A4U9RWE1_HATHI|nr:DNA adenine methylase [Hathewaya histolytica]VTQ96168.1 adenine-specific DNA-methyltransferase [Hathewaya histolytica]
MRNEIRTQEIIKKYDLSRQTLYRWIKQELITEPKRDWRNWRVWTNENILEIEEIMKSKNKCINKKDKMVERGYFDINNRRYLGSKYKLLGFINEIVDNECDNVKSVADIFGGTGTVAKNFYDQGKSIIVNDILESNYLSYKTWFSNEKIDIEKISRIIDNYNSIEVICDNYVSENFGGTYFSIENSRKIGYIREEINRIKNELTEREYAALITSLLYAMDKVANTCGHYDAYRRKLDSVEPLKLLIPNLSTTNDKDNKIYNIDANKLVRDIEVDLVYIDTPYNSRQYGDAYHLLENIARWEKPRVEGIARKMVDRGSIKSKYCTAKAPEAFEDLINGVNSRYILVSYNNMAQKGVGRSNAKISNEEIMSILESKGRVNVFSTDYKVFTTGKTNVDEHKELLYLCKCFD